MNPRFAQPAALAFIARMELVARRAVEGFLSGLHPSPYFGSSVEYADHRPYTQGDDLRTIDWKLLAKTDKHYVKLFAEQTNLRATIIVDASKSMSFKSGEMSKLEYACFLAASLSYLLLRQNDAVGLAVIDRSLRTFVPPRATGGHFRVILDELGRAAADRDTALGPVLHEVAGRMKRRGLVILISDLLDDPSALAEAFAHLRHDRHEVIVFHVMDRAELSFPYQRSARFSDIEGGASLIANPSLVRQAYLDRLGAFMTRIKQTCHERGVAYELAPTDAPYAARLSGYLERRGRIAVRLM
jgi:uncharacterized protein (DUF58 family)